MVVITVGSFIHNVLVVERMLRIFYFVFVVVLVNAFLVLFVLIF